MDVEACATEATWRVTRGSKALDTEDDANETVTFTPEIVGDVDFAPEAADLVPAQVTITEGPGVALSTLSLRVLERNSSTYTVALTSQPTGTGTVTVTPSVSGDPDVTLSPASLSFTPTTWHVAQAVTVSAAEDPDETDDEAVIRHAVSGANYGSVTADDVEVRVQDIDGKVTGDLRMVGSENENEGRLEMFYQGDWGTICDDRFSNWIRPVGGGPAEPNQASKVACRIMGYEGGKYRLRTRLVVARKRLRATDLARRRSVPREHCCAQRRRRRHSGESQRLLQRRACPAQLQPPGGRRGTLHGHADTACRCTGARSTASGGAEHPAHDHAQLRRKSRD